MRQGRDRPGLDLHHAGRCRCRRAPQLTAIMDAAEAAQSTNTPVIADGGIKFSVIWPRRSLPAPRAPWSARWLAGTEERPARCFLYQGRSYKSYRGMGSVSAMARGSADRYFQQDIKGPDEARAEGIEVRYPIKARWARSCTSFTGGLARGDGLCRRGQFAANSATKAEFVRHHQCGPAREPCPRRHHHPRGARIIPCAGEV